jgi:hypothetical protein
MSKVFRNGDNKIQDVSSSILEDITRKYFLDLFNKKIKSKENRGMLKIKLNFIFDN